ncbi:protein SRG1-like [Senna tora]|uniref:Protein SRG1-like n=1 Tax=Senna tora TaxID=362788 RepID=A0A834WDG5_9FABA|nr:protein SRG1-like [Senna tora]
MDNINYMPSLSSDIPIIDLALLSLENQEELFKLDAACKNWGFFQLVNHGVKKEVQQRMKDGAIRFYGKEEASNSNVPIKTDKDTLREGYSIPQKKTQVFYPTCFFNYPKQAKEARNRGQHSESTTPKGRMSNLKNLPEPPNAREE